ncbi:hypothetical protein [Paenibacillus sp. PL2-23]|uniref:hypothetical protein n=1 Tax=Paenibacillus sp. PL2-23 TaxID=2100729 RepID=UPI0030F9C68F
MKQELLAIMNSLDGRETVSPLLPKRIWDEALDSRIAALTQDGFPAETTVIALMAGLHLRNDSLDRSHAFAQEIEHDATGAYWHGIMHRMEGDFYNSKYWFRQAGHHPAMKLTQTRVAEWLGGAAAQQAMSAVTDPDVRGTLLSFQSESGWEPSAFVDLIVWQERHASNELRPLLEKLQDIELRSLFEHTLAAAKPYWPEAQ